METRNDRRCKDLIIKSSYSSEKIKCEHPEHMIIFRGTEIYCKCR
jgi:hypothetical protein